MEIGPNLTSVILSTITLITVIVTAVFGFMKAKKIEGKVDAVADGMQSKMIAAQDKAAIGVGKAEQVGTERVEERKRANERLLAADESALARGVEIGQGRASNFGPLEK